MTIRIAVVDDQVLVLRGISELLQDEEDFDVVGQFTSGSELRVALDSLELDVLVLDIRMPMESGIETLSKIRQRGAALPTLMLTTFDDEALLLAATKAGAQGFMLKDSRPEDFVAAIRTLHDGGRYFEPVPTAALRRHERFSTSGTPPVLSARERQVLRLMAGGYSNREIAQALRLAEGTIKNYVSEILARLECRDRTKAVLKAIGLGLV